MNAPNTRNLTAFGLSAVSLDNDFAEFERLGGEIERLSIDSDSGLERARKLLSHFSECGQRIGDGMQVLAKELDNARISTEQVAQRVAAQAVLIQERQNLANRLFERYQTLGEMLAKITAAVSQLQRSGNGRFSEEEKALLAQHMPQLNSQMDVLITESRKLKNDAAAANMKTVEKNADSLTQKMQTVRDRLGTFVERSA